MHVKTTYYRPIHIYALDCSTTVCISILKLQFRMCHSQKKNRIDCKREDCKPAHKLKRGVTSRIRDNAKISQCTLNSCFRNYWYRRINSQFIIEQYSQ